MEQANFSELKEKINAWDTQAEELLIQKVKLFTLNYNEDFQSLCKNFDNFANAISSVQVEHLKAINQLKNLSNERFIEQSLESKEEASSENANEGNDTQEVLMNDTEKKQKVYDISLQFIESISRKNKKEVIEDDSVSVQSSKLTIEKNTKGVKIPFIFNTEQFNADKAIGLDVLPEEENDPDNPDKGEENDPDMQNFIQDIPVNPKERAKWEKVKIKKEEKAKKAKLKKEKQKQKKEKSKKAEEIKEPPEEPEVKVPIENEGESIKEEKKSSSNEIKVVAKSGGSVPPPPPPPPPPPVLKAPVNPPKKPPAPKPSIQNQPPSQVLPQDPSSENPTNPENQNNDNNLNEQPIPDERAKPDIRPMNPQDELRKMILNRGKKKDNQNINTNISNTKEVNNKNEILNSIQTLADNKNPLAPVIRNENTVITKENVKLNNFMGGRLDDDDDDDGDIGDITKSIFRKNPVKLPQNNNTLNPNKTQMEEEVNNKPVPALFGMPKPEEQNNNNESQQKKILTESQFIEIKQNPNFLNAGKRMQTLFGSDDEDEKKSENIEEKTKNLTNKLNDLGITQNNDNVQKNEEANKTKTKKAFFDDDDEDDIKIKKEENIGKSKEYKEENKNENANITNDNINNQEQPNKNKLAFFNDDDTEQKSETKPEIKNEKTTPNIFDALKEKLAQRNQKLNNKEEPKKEESKKEESKKEEPKKEESKKEEPKKEEPKKEEPKIEEPKIEEPKKEEPKIEEPKIEEPKKEIPDLKRSITSKTNLNKNPLNKRFADMQNMLSNKMGKGMIMGVPKPKQEGEKIEHNAPADKDQSTYEDVIKSSKSLVKKKKPKRNSRFGVGEERIQIPVKPSQDEGNKIQEGNEGNEPEENNKEPKNEESKIEEQNSETNKVNDAPSPPKPSEEKGSDIKNSVFNLFKEDDEPKEVNLFTKVELDSNHEPSNNNQEQNNFNILNNDKLEVQNSQVILNDNINKKEEPTNKKKLAFFDDDDE